MAGNLVGEDALKEGCPFGTIAGGLIFQYADKLHEAIDGTDVVGEIEGREMGETYALYHIGEDDSKEDYAHVAHQLGKVGRLEFAVGTCRGEFLLQAAVETVGCETVNEHGEESQDKEGDVWLDVSPEDANEGSAEAGDVGEDVVHCFFLFWARERNSRERWLYYYFTTIIFFILGW